MSKTLAVGLVIGASLASSVGSSIKTIEDKLSHLQKKGEGLKAGAALGKYIEEFGKKIGEKTVRLLDAKPAPSGKFPVIADPELTGVLIHEALGHAVEGDLILQNDSILKDKIGTQIASDIVNIFDDAKCGAPSGRPPEPPRTQHALRRSRRHHTGPKTRKITSSWKTLALM